MTCQSPTKRTFPFPFPLSIVYSIAALHQYCSQLFQPHHHPRIHLQPLLITSKNLYITYWQGVMKLASRCQTLWFAAIMTKILTWVVWVNRGKKTLTYILLCQSKQNCNMIYILSMQILHQLIHWILFPPASLMNVTKQSVLVVVTKGGIKGKLYSLFFFGSRATVVFGPWSSACDPFLL